MRLVLGKGERERVVRKYMDEMGQQWRGASFSLDYALGLSVSDDISLKSKADEELASWLWRNTFNTRGLGAASSGMVEADSLEGMAMGKGVKELEMLENLSTVVKFVRREMARLDEISDADIMSAHVGSWGAIRE
jgi:cytochrome b pre-mRNA-processing protein 3